MSSVMSMSTTWEIWAASASPSFQGRRAGNICPFKSTSTVCRQEGCEVLELEVEKEVAVSDDLSPSDGTCLIGRRAMRLTWSSISVSCLTSEIGLARTVHGFPCHEESVLCCIETWWKVTSSCKPMKTTISSSKVTLALRDLCRRGSAKTSTTTCSWHPSSAARGWSMDLGLPLRQKISFLGDGMVPVKANCKAIHHWPGLRPLATVPTGHVSPALPKDCTWTSSPVHEVLGRFTLCSRRSADEDSSSKLVTMLLMPSWIFCALSSLGSTAISSVVSSSSSDTGHGSFLPMCSRFDARSKARWALRTARRAAWTLAWCAESDAWKFIVNSFHLITDCCKKCFHCVSNCTLAFSASRSSSFAYPRARTAVWSPCILLFSSCFFISCAIDCRFGDKVSSSFFISFSRRFKFFCRFPFSDRIFLRHRDCSCCWGRRKRHHGHVGGPRRLGTGRLCDLPRSWHWRRWGNHPHLHPRRMIHALAGPLVHHSGWPWSRQHRWLQWRWHHVWLIRHHHRHHWVHLHRWLPLAVPLILVMLLASLSRSTLVVLPASCARSCASHCFAIAKKFPSMVRAARSAGRRPAWLPAARRRHRCIVAIPFHTSSIGGKSPSLQHGSVSTSKMGASSSLLQELLQGFCPREQDLWNDACPV